MRYYINHLANGLKGLDDINILMKYLFIKGRTLKYTYHSGSTARNVCMEIRDSTRGGGDFISRWCTPNNKYGNKSCHEEKWSVSGLLYQIRNLKTVQSKGDFENKWAEICHYVEKFEEWYSEFVNDIDGITEDDVHEIPDCYCENEPRKPISAYGPVGRTRTRSKGRRQK